MSNPYEVPNLDSPPSRIVNSDLRYPRLVLILYLTVICYFATGTLLDRGTFGAVPLLRWIWNTPVLQCIMMLASSACPLAMIFFVGRLKERSRVYRSLIFVFVLLLIAFQIWVMLPAVS